MAEVPAPFSAGGQSTRNLVLTDQALSSASNAVPSLFAATAFTDRSLSHFAIAYLTASVVGAAYRYGSLEPELAGGQKGHWSYRPGRDVRILVMLLIVVLLVEAYVGIEHGLIVAIAIGVLGLLTTDLVRYSAFATQMPTKAVWLDSVWLALVTIGAAVALTFDLHVTPAQTLTAWGLSGFAVSAVLQLGNRSRGAALGSHTDHRRRFVWLGSEAILERGLLLGLIFIATSRNAIEVSSGLERSRVLFSPTGVLLQSSSVLILTSDLSRTTLCRLARFSTRLVVLVAAYGPLAFVALWVLQPWDVDWKSTLAMYAYMLTRAAYYGPREYLKGTGDPRVFAILRASATAVPLAIALLASAYSTAIYVVVLVGAGLFHTSAIWITCTRATLRRRQRETAGLDGHV